MNTVVESPTGEVDMGGRVGRWSRRARDGVVLVVSWRAEGQGGGVVALELEQIAGPGAPLRYVGELGLTPEWPHEQTWALGLPEQPVDVTFRLGARDDGALAVLSANVPLKPNEYFDHAIGQWPLDGPAPPPPPDPDPDEPVEVIEALPGALDLFPFLWMRPLSPAERADARLRYVKVADPTTAQPLYGQLLAVQPPGAAAQKVKLAAAFRGNAAFISSVASLTAPLPQLPALRIAVLAEAGERTLAELKAQAEAVLKEDVSVFMSSPLCATTLADAWQSLWALALSSNAADAPLAQDLEALLRCLHYLQALADDLPGLTHARVRRLLLEATPALPDVVAAWPLQGSAAGGGSWSLLGVGELEQARQHLRGYAAGDLAEVVNLLPGETQERHERQVQSSERAEAEADLRDHQADQGRQTDTASELADTLREALSTGGLVNNLSKIQPSYSNLNEWLSGTAASGEGGAGWGAARAAGLVQRMSEQALERVNERQGRQRHAVWRQWQEQRRSQCIDNRAGARLVGVYRWVDRLVHIRLRPQGRCLVLSLQVPTPAAAWVAQVAAQGPLPLVAPVPLPAFTAADGYTLILPGTYQAQGAAYGLDDLPPPPPDAITLHAQVDRVTVGDTARLVVPAGYQVTSGSAIVAVASSAYSLTGMVGGIALAASTPAKPSELTVTVPDASSGTSVGKPAVQPPTPLPAVVTTVPLDKPVVGMTGAVPLTVISDAPLFGVTVELDCGRVTSPTDPLLAAWQLAVYQRLLDGYRACQARYEAALAQRIHEAAAGHPGQVQRQVLQQACLAVLTASSACTDAQRLIELLDWAHMSWHYDQAITGSTTPVVHDPAAPEATAPASRRLFQQFLRAVDARVLLPVRPGTQAALLYALQWQPYWPAPEFGREVPVDQTVVPLLEEQADAAPPTPERGWTLRLPLPLIYLQQGDALPSFDPPPPKEPS